ncbi:Scr1 family TA system antitoxin-like transcriptional regulator [Streptomyces sp. NPDC048208]|uniref:Scr1 family TA system antitoxin-like transcriptional regulator n=1 Tax=Streptomyces sp. NPDC048208 TaxID=3365515 RepID=UPI00371E9D53
MAVYLRAVRKAAGATLDDAARRTRTSISTVSRMERAEIPVPVSALEMLLRSYGVPPRSISYLLHSYPLHPRSQPHLSRHGLWDQWADMAGSEAIARYAAIPRIASEAVHLTNARIPPSFRTPLYRAVVTASTPAPDEPETPKRLAPAWLAHVTRPPGQRRTLLLEDTLLHRSTGSPTAMAEQLRHLMHLMDNPRETSPVTIRVIQRHRTRTPIDGEVAEYTVHGHRLIGGCRFVPWYETRSDSARSTQKCLREAAAQALDRDLSYQLIQKAAERWEAAS